MAHRARHEGRRLPGRCRAGLGGQASTAGRDARRL